MFAYVHICTRISSHDAVINIAVHWIWQRFRKMAVPKLARFLIPSGIIKLCLYSSKLNIHTFLSTNCIRVNPAGLEPYFMRNYLLPVTNLSTALRRHHDPLRASLYAPGMDDTSRDKEGNKYKVHEC